MGLLNSLLHGCLPGAHQKPTKRQLLRIDSKLITEISRPTESCAVHVSWLMGAFEHLPPDWTAYDVLNDVVLPQTSHWRCRFVDTIDPSYVGAANYLVCYTQSAPFSQLIHALRHRFYTADGQELPDTADAYLWIDVFAINHHKQGYKEEYFALRDVLKGCRASLLVLDGRCRVISRLVPLYVIWATLQEAKESKGQAGPVLEVLTGCADPRYLRNEWLHLDLHAASIARDCDADWLLDHMMSRGKQRIKNLIRQAIADSARRFSNTLCHRLQNLDSTVYEQDEAASTIHDLHVCATIIQLSGHYSDAAVVYEQARQLLAACGDTLQEDNPILLLQHHAELLLLLKKWDEAKLLAEETLTLCWSRPGASQDLQHFPGTMSGAQFSTQAYAHDRGANAVAARVPEPIGLHTPPELPCTILLARAMMGLGKSDQAEELVRRTCSAQKHHSHKVAGHGALTRKLRFLRPATRMLTGTHDEKYQRVRLSSSADAARAKMAVADVLRLREDRDPSKALKLYLKAQHGMSKALGPKHPDVAYVQMRIGQLLRSQRKLESAQQVLLQVLGCYKQSWGDFHPETASAQVYLAEVELAMLHTREFQFTDAELQSALQKATQQYMQAFEIRRACLGLHHPDTLATLAGAIVQLLNSSTSHVQLSKAEPMCGLAVKSSMAMQQQGTAGTHSAQGVGVSTASSGKVAANMVSSMVLMAVMLATAGKAKEAIQVFSQGLQVCEGELAPHHQMAAHCWMGAADILQVRHDWAGAEKHYRQALTTYSCLLDFMAGAAAQQAAEAALQPGAGSMRRRSINLVRNLARISTAHKPDRALDRPTTPLTPQHLLPPSPFIPARSPSSTQPAVRRPSSLQLTVTQLVLPGESGDDAPQDWHKRRASLDQPRPAAQMIPQCLLADSASASEPLKKVQLPLLEAGIGTTGAAESQLMVVMGPEQVRGKARIGQAPSTAVETDIEPSIQFPLELAATFEPAGSPQEAHQAAAAAGGQRPHGCGLTVAAPPVAIEAQVAQATAEAQAEELAEVGLPCQQAPQLPNPASTSSVTFPSPPAVISTPSVAAIIAPTQGSRDTSTASRDPITAPTVAWPSSPSHRHRRSSSREQLQQPSGVDISRIFAPSNRISLSRLAVSSRSEALKVTPTTTGADALLASTDDHRIAALAQAAFASERSQSIPGHAPAKVSTDSLPPILNRIPTAPLAGPVNTSEGQSLASSFRSGQSTLLDIVHEATETVAALGHDAPNREGPTEYFNSAAASNTPGGVHGFMNNAGMLARSSGQFMLGGDSIAPAAMQGPAIRGPPSWNPSSMDSAIALQLSGQLSPVLQASFAVNPVFEQSQLATQGQQTTPVLPLVDAGSEPIMVPCSPVTLTHAHSSGPMVLLSHQRSEPLVVSARPSQAGSRDSQEVAVQMEPSSPLSGSRGSSRSRRTETLSPTSCKQHASQFTPGISAWPAVLSRHAPMSASFTGGMEAPGLKFAGGSGSMRKTGSLMHPIKEHAHQEQGQHSPTHRHARSATFGVTTDLGLGGTLSGRESGTSWSRDGTGGGSDSGGGKGLAISRFAKATAKATAKIASHLTASRQLPSLARGSVDMAGAVAERLVQVPKLGEVAVTPHQLLVARRQHIAARPYAMLLQEAAAAANNLALLLRWTRNVTQAEQHLRTALQQVAWQPGALQKDGSGRLNRASPALGQLDPAAQGQPLGRTSATYMEAPPSPFSAHSSRHGQQEPGHSSRHAPCDVATTNLQAQPDPALMQIRVTLASNGPAGLPQQNSSPANLREQVSGDGSLREPDAQGQWSLQTQGSRQLLCGTISGLLNQSIQDPQAQHLHALMMSNLAGLLYAQGAVGDAEELYQHAITRCSAVSRHTDAMLIGLNLIRLYSAQGQAQKALDVAQKVVAKHLGVSFGAEPAARRAGHWHQHMQPLNELPTEGGPAVAAAGEWSPAVMAGAGTGDASTAARREHEPHTHAMHPGSTTLNGCGPRDPTNNHMQEQSRSIGGPGANADGISGNGRGNGSMGLYSSTCSMRDAISNLQQQLFEALSSRMVDDGGQTLYQWAADAMARHRHRRYIPETVFLLQVPGIHLQCVHMVRWPVVVEDDLQRSSNGRGQHATMFTTHFGSTTDRTADGGSP